MSPHDILARVKKKPFIPMRIITSAGEQYDVYDPDLIMVGNHHIHVGTASEDNPAIFDRSKFVTVQHLTAIENLPAPVPPKPEGNGL
jgi:hypothetical protein